MLSWRGGTASRFRRRRRTLRRRSTSCMRRRGPAVAVDPRGFPRSSSIAAAAAEIPRRRAGRAQDRAHAVGGRRSPRPRGEVEADREGRGFAGSCARPLGDQHGPRRAIPCRRCRAIRLALVDQAEAADIAVVAGLDAGSRHCPRRGRSTTSVDALAERCRRQDRGRIGVVEHQRAWAAVVRSASTSSARKRGRQRRRAAAIDHQPLRRRRDISNARVEAQPPAAMRGGGGGAASSTSTRAERATAADSPSRAPGAAAGRAAPQPSISAASAARRRRVAALPARQRAVAHGHAMKRGERGRGGAFERVGQRLLGGEIGRAEQAEPVDQQHLLVRRAADQPAVLELRSGRARGSARPRRARAAPRRPGRAAPAATTPAQAVIRGRPGAAPCRRSRRDGARRAPAC